MVGIVKFFGWLGVIASVVLFGVSFSSIYAATILVPVGASALLGGAVLVAFARMLELLESIDKKMTPVSVIAASLAGKYGLQTEIEEKGQQDPFENLPEGTQMKSFKGRRVAFLPGGSVFAETMTGPRTFQSFDEYRDFIGE